MSLFIFTALIALTATLVSLSLNRPVALRLPSR